jgi:diguanylate cyclase (GGDEF)-like protein
VACSPAFNTLKVRIETQPFSTLRSTVSAKPIAPGAEASSAAANRPKNRTGTLVMLQRLNAGVWAFNALLVVGALFCASTLGSATTPILPTPLGLPWYLMIGVAAAAEMCLFSVRYRNDAQTFTLGEVSYALGAVFYPPKQFLAAAAIGLTLVFLARRAPATRMVFNVGATTLAACVVIATTRALAGSHAHTNSLSLWFGIILGAAIACPVQAILVGLVRTIAERRFAALTEAPRVIFFSELNSIAVAAMGVLIAIVLSVAPAVAIIGLVPLGLLYIAFSQLVQEHTRRANVEFLYETAQGIHNTPDIEQALTNLLDRSLKSFHADFGAIVLRRPDSSQWVSFCVGQTSGGLTKLDAEPRWIPKLGQAVALDRKSASHGPSQLLDQLQANQLFVSTLMVDDEVYGLLIVADSGNNEGAFGEDDRRLFELLAKQVAIGVENSQLERSLGVLSRLEEELRYQANHDALTGLANRTMLNQVLKQSTEHDRAVLLIDLDDFKIINDSLGHAAGDEVLIEVAKRLRRAVREDDLVARLGGDEFAVVLGSGASPQRAIEAAERISTCMAPSLEVFGRKVHIHASVGVAAAVAGVAVEELLRSADVAMYQAKNAGKGQHKLFESGMDDSARDRLQIITGLELAVTNAELVIEYQPIVDLRTQGTVAVEALLRWNHPELGRLGPDRFIPFAEESGAIAAIGAWTLEQSCRDIAPLSNTQGEPLELHVNVSPQQIAATDFVATVTSILARSAMDPRRLVLEITEKTALADSSSVITNVHALRVLNIQLALDDFGTGYSSLAAAHSFPLDIIKIDQLFVKAITAKSEATLVRAIIAMADSLELSPVAEGIETQDQLDKLVQFGCAFGQGYLFSKAVPLDVLKAWHHVSSADKAHVIARSA